MECSLNYDALSSPLTFASFEKECDALSGFLLNNGSDSLAATCNGELFLDYPPMHEMFASKPEGPTLHPLAHIAGRPLFNADVEPWLGFPLAGNLDQTRPQQPSDSSPPFDLAGLEYTTTGPSAHDDGFSLMNTSPLCLNPAVLSSSPTQQLASSLQGISLSDRHIAGPSHDPEVLSRRNQHVVSSSPSFSSSSNSDPNVSADTDEDRSDYDYSPSSSVRSGARRYSPYKKRRASGRALHSVSSVSPPTSPTPSSSSTPFRPRCRARPRNVQADVSPAALEDSRAGGSCMCPVPGCNHVPATGRMPDLRRHMRTHRARDSQDTWVCCGVFLKDAGEYGITDTSQSYEYKGFTMVGGCRQGFSRKDALIRHLRNDNIQCRGDADLSERLSRE